MNLRTRSSRAAVTLLGALLAASAQSATIDYSSTGNNTSLVYTWPNGVNWVGGTAPVNDLVTDTAQFNQTSYTTVGGYTVTFNTVSIGGIISGNAAFSANGNNLNLGSGGISMLSTSAGATFSATANVILGASQTWDNSSSANSLVVSGTISGANSINKTGVGVLALGGANTFSGGLTLTAGGLRAGQNGSFGTGTLTLNGGNISSASLSNGRVIANTVVVGGNVQFGNSVGTTVAALELTGPVTINGNRTISFVNNGVGVKGNVTLNGNLTLDTAIATIQTVSSGNITNGLTTGGNTIAGVISDGSGSFGIIKTGSGVVALTGANTFTGNITINQGTLSITNAFIADTATVSLLSGSVFNLNFSGTDTVAGLYLAGVAQAEGTYGAIGSGATFTSSFFTGNGILNVSAIPEPSTYALVGGALVLGLTVTRRRRS